ncbi:hypothetical protein ACC710_36695, partial [Rhizobium ruizarguesonis]
EGNSFREISLPPVLNDPTTCRRTGDVVTADGSVVLGWLRVEELPMQFNTAARNINTLIHKDII